MSAVQASPAPESGPTPLVFVLAALLGAALAVVLGVYGKIHDPSGENVFTLFFTATINMKAWFASAALALGLFQLYSALRMFGKIGRGRPVPGWLPLAHRISGFSAILLSLPVAYHCLWSLGFQQTSLRQVVHSLAGCFFYGTFFTKVVIVRSSRSPSWALPVVGGALFTALVVVWCTSALWFFLSFGFPSV